MKTLQLISYEYPNKLTLQIGGQRYLYRSSEFFLRRFLACYQQGGRFNSLNWLKRVAKVEKI